LDLESPSITAITADQAMKNQLETDSTISLRPNDKILVGNWMDDDFCKSLQTEKYDTILADYLIGAVDGFSPYSQDLILLKYNIIPIFNTPKLVINI